MSRELTKMNLIAIVQQLPEEDIHTIETYIKMIEQENKILQEKFSIVSEMNVDSYNKYCEALKENVMLKDKITELEIQLEDRAYNELKIAYNKLKDRINKAIEYIEDSFEKEYGKSKKELRTYNLKNCSYDASLVALGILRGDNNE